MGGSIEKVSIHYPGSGDSSTEEYFTYGYYTYNDFSVAYDGTVSTVKDNTVGIWNYGYNDLVFGKDFDGYYVCDKRKRMARSQIL